MQNIPHVPIFVITMLCILFMALLMKKFRQPYVVAYLVVGIILGPYGLSVISDQEALTSMGEIGVVLLLFFIGMEINPKKLIKNITIPAIATLLQVIISILFILLISLFTKWTFPMVVLLGFTISLSSTAVILKLLQDWGEMDNEVSRNVIGILVVQDLAIVPMMIILGLLSGRATNTIEIYLEIIGGIAMIIFCVFLTTKENIKIPFIKWFNKDREMETFAALAICFGISTITALLGLSSALGAFLAGMLISSAKETEWVHSSLSSIKIIFIALFFISIGMMVDMKFIWSHFFSILFLLLIIYVINMFINALALSLLKQSFESAIYGSSLLSQVGEFGFVIVGVGFSSGIIDKTGYSYCVTVIALSLLFSPMWISITKHFSRKLTEPDLSAEVLAKVEPHNKTARDINGI